MHLPQEITGKVQEDAAISLSIQRLFIHGNMVVARNKDTFSLSHMDLLFAVVQYHFARIHIVHRILPRAVDTAADVVVKEAVEHVLVVEYELHRTGIFFYLFVSHNRIDYLLPQNYKI